MGVLQNAADLARIYLHSAGGGLIDSLGQHLGGEDAAQAARNQQELEAARQRQGFAGSVANVAGFVAPGGVASDVIRGVRALPAVIRAVPRALEAVPAAERAITGLLPQSGRAIARARLGLPELPTVSETIGRNIAGAVKAHPYLYGAGALGGGALALSDDYGHSSAAQAAPVAKVAAPAPAKAAAPVAAAAQSQAPAQEKVSPLDQLIGSVAKSQGGKLSLNQLGAIGSFVAQTSPELKHPSTYKDNAAEQSDALSQFQFQQSQALAKQLQDKGDMAGAHKALMDGISARKSDLSQILGQNPMDMMMAQQYQQLQPDQ